MSDIIKAMEKEKEYLSYRMKGEEPWHLIDKLKECGFKTLKEYFDEKKSHQFSKLEFKYIEKQPAECIAEVMRMVSTGITGVLFVDSEETFVFNGTATYNKEYCQTHNIPVFPIQTKGGTIVSTTGDFSFGLCCPKNIEINAEFILNEIKNILQNHTEQNVIVDGNDVLIGGKKVIGSATYVGSNVFMFVAHVSFSDKSGLIESICTPNKISKPVGYVDCVDREVFKRRLLGWLRIQSV